MTGRNLEAARAKEEEDIKSQIAVETIFFLYMLLVVTIGLSVFGLKGNAWSRHGIPALDVIITVFYFTAVTMEMQAILVIVLSSKPPASRIPSPLNEWMVGITAWLFLITYFVNYASVSFHAPDASNSDLIVAGIASAVNLPITVYSVLHRRVEG